MKANTSVILLLLSILPALSHAQQVISLEGAIDSALRNNTQLKSQRLSEACYRKLQETAWDINKTNVTAEWGHVNSAYTDSRYGVSQSISFPTVYAKQKAILNHEWKAAQLQTDLKEKELVKRVSLLYNEINSLYQKQILLELADSLYAEFERKAQLRYELGAANALEKATAANQRGQIHLQLEQLHTDLQILINQFGYLVNTKEIYIPEKKVLKVTSPVLAVTGVERHPYLSVLQVQRTIAHDVYKLEQSKLLPEITGGYYNQSFSGWQKVDNVDRFYTQAQRFSSAQIGLSIPIVFSPHTARIKAASLNRKIADAREEDGRRRLAMQYESTIAVYTKRVKTVDYYEKTGIKNAEQIFRSAGSQFAEGDISYLEYTMLLNQAFDINNRYYDELKQRNESIFEINYFTKE